MIKESLLFLTHTDCGVKALKKYGLGIGPNTDLESVFADPLRRIFSKVICYDVWKNYALLGVVEANRQIIEIVHRERPRYVLWHTMMYELLENTLAEIRANGSLVLAWFSDDEVRFDNYSKWWAPYLDFILTNNQDVVKKYESLGSVAIHSVSGSNPAVFKKLNLPAKYEVSFVGRKFGDRGLWIEQLNKSGVNVDAFGNGWEAGYVSTVEMVNIFNTSKINLCFMQSYGTNTRPQLKTRIFEVCMCGGFLLCEHVSGIEDYFEPDKEIVCFYDIEDVKAKIQYYLKNDKERESIACAGWARAKANYSQETMLYGIFRKVKEYVAAQKKCVTPLDLDNFVMPKSVRSHPSQYHMAWARGLMIEGYPRKRWQEEIDIALRYDSANQDALRLRKISNLPVFLKTALIKADAIIGRTKSIQKKVVSIFPVVRQIKPHIRRIKHAFEQHEMTRKIKKDLKPITAETLSDARDKALSFAEKLRIKEGAYGMYRYSSSGTAHLLYASVYAAMLRHLLDDLQRLTWEQRNEWIIYINSFQCEDGLYRDPFVRNDIAEKEDWWGWRHLTAHVITALTCLGGRPRYPFAFLETVYAENAAYSWISNLPWREKPDYVSNTVMNYVVLLQYERDFNKNTLALRAVEQIFSFLDKTQNPDTGLWGNISINDRAKLSIGVQTAYHLWNLYFYDNRPIQYMERAIDSCLSTQNTIGGYGVALNSSACEDIDSIDPLCRFYIMLNYRRADIENSIKKALPWILVNKVADSGFVFRRFEKFAYGHVLMTTGPDESQLFSTWFRILSLAYITQVLEIFGMQADAWKWVKCPGYQFWHHK